MPAVRFVKDRDGIPMSRKVDRALRAWLGLEGFWSRSQRHRGRLPRARRAECVALARAMRVRETAGGVPMVRSRSALSDCHTVMLSSEGAMHLTTDLNGGLNGSVDFVREGA
jgi:hypothetical protein